MKAIKLIKYSTLKINKSNAFEGDKRNSFEADIVISGMLEIVLEDTVLNLHPGDIIILPPNTYRSMRDLSENGTVFTEIHFSFSDKTYYNKNFKYCRLNYNNALLASILDDEINENNGACSDAANAIFEALILRCLNENSGLDSISASHYNIYRDAIAFMNKKTNIMLSVPEIAHNCGICETTLKNAFKQYTGKSVKKYYNELKIRNAIELLKKGINAKEVAVTLGFSTLSYFSQFFKRETGCNIRDFIKENSI